MIDRHGLTGVDWAAIATGLATEDQQAILWRRLRDEKLFHYGGMPTGIAVRPETYEPWEFTVGDRHDVAAMGRRWFLEAWARSRMGDGEGLLDGLRAGTQNAGGAYQGKLSRTRFTAARSEVPAAGPCMQFPGDH